MGSSPPDHGRLIRPDVIRLGVNAGPALTLDAFPAAALALAQTAAPRASHPPSREKLPVAGIGTARNYENPVDNLGAARCRLPEAAIRGCIETYYDAL